MKLKNIAFIFLTLFISIQSNAEDQYVEQIIKYINNREIENVRPLLDNNFEVIIKNSDYSYRIAKAFYDKKVFDISTLLFNKVILVNDNNVLFVNSCLYLSNIYSTFGDFYESVNILTKGFQHIDLLDDKQKSQYYDNLGYAQVETCDPENGLNNILKALQLDKSNKQAKDDLSYYERWDKNNELVFPLKKTSDIKKVNGFGYYSFKIFTPEVSSSISKIIPYYKLILHNENDNKNHGICIKPGKEEKGVYLLPIGKYTPVKLAYYGKKGAYPSDESFEIKENRIVVHFNVYLEFFKVEDKLNPKKPRIRSIRLLEKDTNVLISEIENINKEKMEIINLIKND